MLLFLSTLSSVNTPPPIPHVTKTTFTVPADTWAELRRLTGDKSSRGFAPILGKPGVRFSRDRYLCEVLAGELENLSRLPVNSEAAARALTTEAIEHRRRARDSYTKINLSLASSVAAELTRIATEKRIPRDLLMSRIIEIVVRSLRKADAMANSPFEDAYLFDAEPYSDLFLSKEDLDERRDAALAIFAISRLKGVSIGTADEAYWKLPRAKRRDLRNRSNVRAAIKKHRKEWQRLTDTPVDLTDLLQPSPRPRKPA